MVVDNRKPKTISVVINNPTNNAHEQVNTHEDIINQRLNESELDLNSKVIRFTSGDPLPSNYPPREENLPNKIIVDENPRKPEIVHLPNKLIKLVKKNINKKMYKIISFFYVFFYFKVFLISIIF